MDGISVTAVTQPAIEALRDMDRRTDRATMWALREVGRRLNREAKRRVPVYKGPAPTVSLKAIKAARRAGNRTKNLEGNMVVPGLLKASIHSSRNLKRERQGVYRLTTGPRGPRVHLYAGKIEERSPYMRPAYEATLPEVVALHAKAWEKAMKR